MSQKNKLLENMSYADAILSANKIFFPGMHKNVPECGECTKMCKNVRRLQECTKHDGLCKNVRKYEGM